MRATVSHTTSVSIVCSTVGSGTDKKKTSKLRVTGLCVGNSPVGRWIPRAKGQLRGKCFHLMTSSWWSVPGNAIYDYNAIFVTYVCFILYFTMSRLVYALVCRHHLMKSMLRKDLYMNTLWRYSTTNIFINYHRLLNASPSHYGFGSGSNRLVRRVFNNNYCGIVWMKINHSHDRTEQVFLLFLCRYSINDIFNHIRMKITLLGIKQVR